MSKKAKPQKNPPALTGRRLGEGSPVLFSSDARQHLDAMQGRQPGVLRMSLVDGVRVGLIWVPVAESGDLTGASDGIAWAVGPGVADRLLGAVVDLDRRAASWGLVLRPMPLPAADGWWQPHSLAAD